MWFVCVLQVFSCFLPNVSLERTSSWAKDKDDRDFSFDDSAILIKRGTLIHGAQSCSTLSRTHCILKNFDMSSIYRSRYTSTAKQVNQYGFCHSCT
jgi:hypothetical protein